MELAVLFRENLRNIQKEIIYNDEKIWQKLGEKYNPSRSKKLEKFFNVSSSLIFSIYFP